MWMRVVWLTWYAWLAFGVLVVISALVLGQDQVRNLVIALIATGGATAWWAWSRRLVANRDGRVATFVGLLNAGLLVLVVGLLGGAAYRVFVEGYAVFG